MIEVVWDEYGWSWIWEEDHEDEMEEQCLALLLGLA